MQERDATATLERSTDGYDDLDLTAGYRTRVTGVDWTVFARGTNLIDTTQRRHVSFLVAVAPLPGRSGMVGLRARF